MQNSNATRRAIVIVGMHRSGTSAMARVLSLVGAALPAKLMQPSRDNPTGHWEPQSVVDYNDVVLAELDSRWDDAFGPQRRTDRPLEIEGYIERAREIVRAEYRDTQLIVLKDPRVSRLSGIWHSALEQEGYQVCYILMLRRPDEVAASLLARDGMERNKALLLWTSHLVASEFATRASPRQIVSYDQLLADPDAVLDRVEKALGFPFPRRSWKALADILGFVDPTMNHHSHQTAMKLPPVFEPVRQLYDYLLAAEAGAVSKDDVPDQVRTWQQNVAEVAAPMVAALNERIDELAAEIDGHVAALAIETDCFAAERLSLQQTVAALELAQTQRDAEIAQFHNEAAEAAAHQAAKLDEMAAHGQNLQAVVDQQVREAAARDAEMVTLAEQLAAQVDHSEHHRLISEAADKRIYSLEAEVIRLNAAVEEAAMAVRTAADHAAERAIAMQELQTATGTIVQQVADRDAQVAALEAEAGGLRETIDALESERAQAQALRQEIEMLIDQKFAGEQRLNERFREIAGLTRLIQERDQLITREQVKAEWLRRMVAVLTRGFPRSGKPRLAALIPTGFSQLRQKADLKRHGLFDPAEYISANPDVGSSGVDPLRHYINHGIPEGRLVRPHGDRNY